MDLNIENGIQVLIPVLEIFDFGFAVRVDFFARECVYAHVFIGSAHRVFFFLSFLSIPSPTKFTSRCCWFFFLFLCVHCRKTILYTTAAVEIHRRDRPSTE